MDDGCNNAREKERSADGCDPRKRGWDRAVLAGPKAGGAPGVSARIRPVLLLLRCLLRRTVRSI
eukprot:1852397-Rhodomonas_salina.1